MRPLTDRDHTMDRLTARQIEVLRLVGRGMTNRQIGDGLGLSEKTVKAHVSAIFRVLGVANRTQAALVARAIAGMAATRAPTNRPRE